MTDLEATHATRLIIGRPLVRVQPVPSLETRMVVRVSSFRGQARKRRNGRWGNRWGNPMSALVREVPNPVMRSPLRTATVLADANSVQRTPRPEPYGGSELLNGRADVVAAP